MKIRLIRKAYKQPVESKLHKRYLSIMHASRETSFRSMIRHSIQLIWEEINPDQKIQWEVLTNSKTPPHALLPNPNCFLSVTFDKRQLIFNMTYKSPGSPGSPVLGVEGLPFDSVFNGGLYFTVKPFLIALKSKVNKLQEANVINERMSQ